MHWSLALQRLLVLQVQQVLLLAFVGPEFVLLHYERAGSDVPLASVFAQALDEREAVKAVLALQVTQVLVLAYWYLVQSDGYQ